MRYPDTVAVRCSGEWYTLQGTTESWKYNAIQVSFRLNGDSLSLFVNAPQLELEMIRCNWKQTFNPGSKCLGDHWERTYGDLSWESPALTRRAPWYMLISDGVLTQAFGVKTGPNSICSWQA